MRSNILSSGLTLLLLCSSCSSDDDAPDSSTEDASNNGESDSTSDSSTSSDTDSQTASGTNDTSSGGSSTTSANGASASSTHAGATTTTGGNALPLPPPSCAADGGSADVSAPELVATLFDSYHEAWLASPAVADIDEDGEREIIAARGNVVVAWHLDNSQVFNTQVAGGRIWASPVVADLVDSSPGLEVAVAARGEVYVWNAEGSLIAGFPSEWRDELRSLAAGDIDNDGSLELVAATTNKLESGGLTDIIIAFELDGSVVAGFPPNTTGTAGCGESCFTHSVYDQNVALGDLNGDGSADILVPQDNAYISLHHGSGLAFDADPMFEDRPKVNGVRFMHVLEEAQQGWAPEEETALQAHFTNTAPTLADVDGDGSLDIVMLASVQNASQSDRLKGVAVWAIHPDGTRLDSWGEPLHFPDYVAGLWDFDGTNVVGATCQISVADITPNHDGPELVFAGFDGRIHAVSSARDELWAYQYTSDERVLTGGVVIADLSKDGVPEIVFNSYSPDDDKSHLFVLDAGGNELFKIALPGRGAMPVPTVADVDQDGTLEIVVSLKDGEDGVRQVLVYSVPSSGENCMPWPTGRGNLYRSGEVPVSN